MLRSLLIKLPGQSTLQVGWPFTLLKVVSNQSLSHCIVKTKRGRERHI